MEIRDMDNILPDLSPDYIKKAINLFLSQRKVLDGLTPYLGPTNLRPSYYFLDSAAFRVLLKDSTWIHQALYSLTHLLDVIESYEEHLSSKMTDEEKEITNGWYQYAEKQIRYLLDSPYFYIPEEEFGPGVISHD